MSDPNPEDDDQIHEFVKEMISHIFGLNHPETILDRDHPESENSKNLRDELVKSLDQARKRNPGNPELEKIADQIEENQPTKLKVNRTVTRMLPDGTVDDLVIEDLIPSEDSENYDDQFSDLIPAVTSEPSTEDVRITDLMTEIGYVANYVSFSAIRNLCHLAYHLRGTTDDEKTWDILGLLITRVMSAVSDYRPYLTAKAIELQTSEGWSDQRSLVMVYTALTNLRPPDESSVETAILNQASGHWMSTVGDGKWMELWHMLFDENPHVEAPEDPI